MTEVSFAGNVDKPGSSREKKTGSWRSFKPIFTEKCIGCGQCVTICPEFAIELVEKDGEKKAKVDYDYCKGCLICSKICPVKAIMEGKE